MKEFVKFLSDFNTLLGLCSKLAAAAPFADLLLQWGPPWPTRAGVAVFSTLLQLAGLAYVFELWMPLPELRLQKRMLILFWLLIFCVVFYVISFIALVISCPADDSNKVVTGFIYQADVRELLGTPGYPNRAALLNHFSCEPERVWTDWSVLIARCWLLVLWLGMWTSLAMYFGTFVLLQKCKSPVPPVATAP